MGTRKFLVGILSVILTFALCSNVFAQENRILMTTAQQYQNMVADGDFESWGSGTTSVPDGWGSVAGAVPTYAQDTSERIGTYAVQLTAGAGSDKGMQQAVTVVPRTTYTISIYYKSSATGHTAKLYVNGASALVTKEDLETQAGTWKRYSGTFTTGASDTSVTIKLYAADGETVSFDGVIFSEGHATPAFAALPITDTGDHTMYGGLTVYGTADLKGDVNLGDLSTDNITLKGTLKGITDTNIAIVPQGAGIVSITGDLTVSGAVNIAEGAIQDARIITADLKDGAVTSAKIALDTILADNIAAGAVTTSEILDATIATADLADSAVTSAKIAADTIVAGDIATGAVETTEILDGTIAAVDLAAGAVLRAKLNELRPHTNSPTNTIYVEAGTVTVESNTAKAFAGGATGAFDPIVTTGNSRIDLVTIDSTPVLAIVKGTEAVSPATPSYPTNKVVIAEVVIDELTTAVIDSSEITDVRPFLSLGGGSGMSSITGTTSETFTIGDDVDADKVLAFEEGATDQTLTWNNASARFDLSNSLSIPTGKQYMVNGVQISSDNLSDVSSIAMLDESEIVTGGWTFNTANTTFTTAIDVNSASTIAGLDIDGTGVLKIAGTTAIDASRNLSNIGTISSTGNHTLDGALAFTGPQAITTSTGDLTLNPAGAINVGAKTISGTTAVIDFSNFDVSSAGAVVAASTVTSAGGAIMDSAAAGNDLTVDAPTVILRGSYDSTAGAGITATDYDATLTHNLTTAGASPASQLEIDVGGGGAELTLTSAGNLTVTGTINDQTIGASSSLAALATSGDLTVNQNSGVADDVYFAVQHNSGNIFTVDKDGDLYVAGNLQVEGTQVILNVETLEVESHKVLLNRNITGSPYAQGALIEVERGTSPNTALRWNETSDIWDLTADGTNYYGILHTNTDLAGDVSGKYSNLQLGTDVVGANELASTAIQAGDIEAGDLPADGYAATYVNTSGNETMSGSLTAASFTFDNSTLNAEQWSTTAGDITLGPAGLNILPSADGTIDLGLQAAIEALSAASRDVGTGTLTLTTSGAFTTYVDNNLTYRVEIDGAGDAGVATYKWSRDGGATWVQTGIVTPTTATELENGFKIAFGGLGGVVGDYWDVTITKNTGYKNLFANTITTDDVYTPSIRAENTGGTVVLTGNFEITGDFVTQGSQTIVGGTTFDGAQIVDVTATEAFLVRKDGDTGDVFIVDTTNSQAEIYNQLGIGKVPASGIELDVTGDADFSGTLKAGTADAFQVSSAGAVTSVGLNAGSGLVTTSGNITTTGTGAITAANGLTVSAGGASVTGGLNNNTGGITNTGAISGATTIVASSTITSLASVGLIPEYDNATLMGDGVDNFGTLSLKYDSTNKHNYYEWTTDEPTTQDYDIVIRYRLPDGFSSFDATAPIKLFNKVSNTIGSTAVTVTMLDTNGNAVTLSGGSGLKNASWTESTITITGSPTFNAEGYVTIIIKMFADQGATVDVGELTLKGNW